VIRKYSGQEQRQVTEAAPTVAALTATAGEDGPAFSQTLLTGAADADNDVLFLQNLAASVTTVSTSTEARTLFLGSDYTLSGSTISLTPFGFAKFNGLSLGEHDTATFNYGVSDGITITPNTFTLTINGIASTVAVASRSAYIFLSAGASSAVWPAIA